MQAEGIFSYRKTRFIHLVVYMTYKRGGWLQFYIKLLHRRAFSRPQHLPIFSLPDLLPCYQSGK